MRIRAIAAIIGMVVGMFTIASTVAAVTWFVVDMRVAPLEANLAAFRSETIARFDKYDARFKQLEATTRRLGEALAEMKGTLEAFVGIFHENVGFDVPASSDLPRGPAHQTAVSEAPSQPVVHCHDADPSS